MTAFVWAAAVLAAGLVLYLFAVLLLAERLS